MHPTPIDILKKEQASIASQTDAYHQKAVDLETQIIVVKKEIASNQEYSVELEEGIKKLGGKDGRIQPVQHKP